MDCAIVQENLVAYSFGELALEEVMKIHQHLGHCKKCAAEEIEFRRTSRFLNRIQPVQLADDFATGLARKLARMPQPKPAKIPGHFRWIYAAAAVLLLALGFEFSPLIFPGPDGNPGNLAAYSSGQAIFNSQKVTTSSSLKKSFLEKYKEKSAF